MTREEIDEIIEDLKTSESAHLDEDAISFWVSLDEVELILNKKAATVSTATA